jgi:hypothetical protein
MYDNWALYQELFMYLDMFYIQWHHLAKKDLWNKVYMTMNIKNNQGMKQDWIPTTAEVKNVCHAPWTIS